jgi:hypothetical protein
MFHGAESDPLARGDATFARDEVLEELFDSVGAFVIGRRTFDLGEEPWGDDPPFQAPCFIPTHRIRATVIKERTTYAFVGDVETAVAQRQWRRGMATLP